MAGFYNDYEDTVLDLALADTDKIAWSENGSTESANLAQTAITAWAAASGGSKSNSGEVETAGATGAATITSFAIFASDGTTQKTDWTNLDAQKTLATGDKLEIATGNLAVTLD